MPPTPPPRKQRPFNVTRGTGEYGCGGVVRNGVDLDLDLDLDFDFDLWLGLGLG